LKFFCVAKVFGAAWLLFVTDQCGAPNEVRSNPIQLRFIPRGSHEQIQIRCIAREAVVSDGKRADYEVLNSVRVQ
jgi:hypothetical protein